LKVVNRSRSTQVQLTIQPQPERGSLHNVRELETAIKEFLDAHNEEPKPLVWTKSADDILARIARFAERTSQIHGL